MNFNITNNAALIEIAQLACRNNGLSYFSEHACVDQIVTEEEVKTTLDTHKITLTPANTQIQSELMELPDVKTIIFNSLANTEIKLSLKDLKNCLYVCKDLNSIVTPIYTQKALSTLKGDFNNIKVDLDYLTIGKINQYPVDFKVRFGIEFPKQGDFNKKTEKLASFKAFCAFLLNNSTKLEDRELAKSILKSAMQLHKACINLLDQDANSLLSKTLSKISQVAKEAFW